MQTRKRLAKDLEIGEESKQLSKSGSDDQSNSSGSDYEDAVPKEQWIATGKKRKMTLAKQPEGSRVTIMLDKEYDSEPEPPTPDLRDDV